MKESVKSMIESVDEQNFDIKQYNTLIGKSEYILQLQAQRMFISLQNFVVTNQDLYDDDFVEMVDGLSIKQIAKVVNLTFKPRMSAFRLEFIPIQKMTTSMVLMIPTLMLDNPKEYAETRKMFLDEEGK
jgi:hypothetical protein